MAKRLNDLAVKVGEYTNSKGQKKNEYKNVGVELQGDDGSTYLLLDKFFNPAGVPDLNGKVSARIAIWKFAPREDNASQVAPKSSMGAPVPADLDDQIPF